MIIDKVCGESLFNNRSRTVGPSKSPNDTRQIQTPSSPVHSGSFQITAQNQSKLIAGNQASISNNPYILQNLLNPSAVQVQNRRKLNATNLDMVAKLSKYCNERPNFDEKFLNYEYKH